MILDPTLTYNHPISSVFRIVLHKNNDNVGKLKEICISMMLLIFNNYNCGHNETVDAFKIDVAWVMVEYLLQKESINYPLCPGRSLPSACFCISLYKEKQGSFTQCKGNQD